MPWGQKELWVLDSSLLFSRTWNSNFNLIPTHKAWYSLGLRLLLPHCIILLADCHTSLFLVLLYLWPLYLLKTHLQSLQFSSHYSTLCKQLISMIVRNRRNYLQLSGLITFYIALFFYFLFPLLPRLFEDICSYICDSSWPRRGSQYFLNVHF